MHKVLVNDPKLGSRGAVKKLTVKLNILYMFAGQLSFINPKPS